MTANYSVLLLGQLATFEMGQSPSSEYVSEEEDGLPFLQGNAEFGDPFPTPQLYCSQPKKLCQPGDILISVRAPVGALNKADQTYVIGRGLAAVRFTEALPEFGWHLLNYWAKDLRTVAQGSTFEAISKGDLQSLRVLLPHPTKQRRIAEILDAADEATRETERLIAKLKAVKAGLLHDLLICGLDEHSHLRDPQAHPEQFKDSPLGRIPRDWEVKGLPELMEPHIGVKPGPFGSSITKSMYTSEGYRVYGQEQAIAGDLSVGDYYVSGSKYLELQSFAVQEGDLLISLVGTIGELLVVRSPFEPGIINPRLIRLRPDRSECDVEFLKHELGSALVYNQLSRMAQGGTMPVLSGKVLKKLRLTKPSLDEQRRIAAVLDAHDTRIRVEEAALEKLRQVKRGMMDDLLTGKVRVQV